MNFLRGICGRLFSNGDGDPEDHSAGNHSVSREANARMLRRREELAMLMAEKLEHDGREMIERARQTGDWALRKDGESNLRLARHLREGGEGVFLVATGAIGRSGR